MGSDICSPVLDDDDKLRVFVMGTEWEIAFAGALPLDRSAAIRSENQRFKKRPREQCSSLVLLVDRAQIPRATFKVFNAISPRAAVLTRNKIAGDMHLIESEFPTDDAPTKAE